MGNPYYQFMEKSFPLEPHQKPSVKKIVWMRIILDHALQFWKQKSTFFLAETEDWYQV